MSKTMLRFKPILVKTMCNYQSIVGVIPPNDIIQNKILYKPWYNIYIISLIVLRTTFYLYYLYGSIIHIPYDPSDVAFLLEQGLYSLFYILSINCMMKNTSINIKTWNLFFTTLESTEVYLLKSFGIDCRTFNKLKYSNRALGFIVGNLLLYSLLIFGQSLWYKKVGFLNGSFYIFEWTSYIFLLHIAFVVINMSLKLRIIFNKLNEVLLMVYRNSIDFKSKLNSRQQRHAVLNLIRSLYNCIEFFNRIFGTTIFLLITISMGALLSSYAFILIIRATGEGAMYLHLISFYMIVSNN